MTHTFAIPVQPHTALIAEDTEDNRRRLKPQVEETLYMPGLQETQMQEMANLARAVFDLTAVTASPSTDTIVAARRSGQSEGAERNLRRPAERQLGCDAGRQAV